jgi:ectoine hydroxylase-related dioxygenase (phytanoyl-CoA dioxygenase family)
MKLPESAVPAGADGLTSRVPWHQDNGVLLEEADDSHVLTVWAPLTPATEENGCLFVVPGSHRWPLLAHCPTEAGYAIPEQAMSLAGAVAVEMSPGSVLLMHQRTVHASGVNRTGGDVRVSLDLRYQPSGEASGRPLYPSFLARSRARPQDVVVGAAEWASLWTSTRARLADRDIEGGFFRWGDGGAACA